MPVAARLDEAARLERAQAAQHGAGVELGELEAEIGQRGPAEALDGGQHGDLSVGEPSHHDSMRGARRRQDPEAAAILYAVPTGLALVETVVARAWARDSQVHGELHWRCVTASGLALADETGADADVVFLFGLLHDTRRENDAFDPGHGPRAAAFARELHAEGLVLLEPARLDLLCTAIELHTRGETSDDPTVGTCWDADRLHLPRCGIDVDVALLSTAMARRDGRVEAAAALREAPPPWSELLRR